MLFVGLGNPGDKYANTRHNAGEIALRIMFPSAQFKNHREWKSLSAAAKWGGQKATLLLPLTYMNLSGDAVRPAIDYLKIEPQEVVVFHDEIELPPGEVRYKHDGGHRGHNGLRDIIKKTGSAAFHRIRIGVGRPPHHDQSVADYVLSPFSKQEIAALEAAQEEISSLLTQNIPQLQ